MYQHWSGSTIWDFLRISALFSGLLGFLCLFSGCGSGANAPPPVSPGLTAPSVVYVVNHNSQNINAYYQDSRSGVLADLNKSPFRSSVPNAWPATLHPSGNFLYVGDTIVGEIQVFSTNFTVGDLSPVNVTFFPDHLNWLTGMSVTPSGRFLYAAANAELDAFGILPDGSLVPLSGSPIPFATSSLQSAVIDPGGQHLYLTDGGSTGRIFAFLINADGSLTAVSGSPFPVSAPLAPAVFDNSGTFLYAADFSNHIYAFKKAADGSLTPLSGFPISTPASTQPIALLFEPTNHFFYASLTPGDSIAAYSLTSSSGALTGVPGSPFTTGNGPNGMATDKAGRFLYVTNRFNDTVTALSIGSTGGLSFASVANTRSSPAAVVIIP
jgi:6-phosphogluconolactonase (cycloisomerase 2 family)